MCAYKGAIICAHAQLKWKMKGAKEAQKNRVIGERERKSKREEKERVPEFQDKDLYFK